MTWDKYFLDICNVVASNSKCFSRKVGAIIVRDKSIVSTGFNGPPRSVSHCNERYTNDEELMRELHKKCITVTDTSICPRRWLGYKSGEGLEWCIAGHGERNAIVNAARNGIAVKDTIMYMNCELPCSPCLIEIINAGISEIVVTNSKSYYDNMSQYLVDESGLKVRTYNLEE